MSLAIRSACIALSSITLLPALCADVIVVDHAGSGDFTLVQTALDAAHDGDIVLVRPGDYAQPLGFLSLSGKALVLIGDQGGETRLPPLLLDSVPEGSTAVLRHLTFVDPGSPLAGLTSATVAVFGSAGQVHIEDCHFVGRDGVGYFAGQSAADGLPALRITDCAAVSLSRCTLVGGRGAGTETPPQVVTSAGGAGLVISSSHVSLHAIEALGGEGGSGLPAGTPGGHGAPGLSVEAGCEVVVSGGAYQGAAGGEGAPGGPSASGLNVAGSDFPGYATTLRHLGVTMLGGPGAPPLEVTDALVVAWQGTPCVLELPAPLRSGETGELALSGPPHAFLGLFFSFGMRRLLLPNFHGGFLPEMPFAGPLLLTSTDANGELTVPLPASDLTPFGLEGVLTLDQVLVQQGAAGLVLSSGSAYVQIGPGY